MSIMKCGIVKFSLAPKLVTPVKDLLIDYPGNGREVKGKVEIFQRFLLKNTT